ncbi:hypothetical protein [Streptomyces collinus]|uniref:hypothetical protein n=1 Tax=Streptomyces collinus TaxID=42684 RepID=UPI0029421A23|nr:hypothetical protein [Streptomyces collinus]
MAAAVNGGAWVYSSFDPTATGWDVSGDTIEASPLFSGIVALADQAAGHRLGNINQALYTLARHKDSGVVDVNDGTDISYEGASRATRPSRATAWPPESAAGRPALRAGPGEGGPPRLMCDCREMAAC